MAYKVFSCSDISRIIFYYKTDAINFKKRHKRKFWRTLNQIRQLNLYNRESNEELVACTVCSISSKPFYNLGGAMCLKCYLWCTKPYMSNVCVCCCKKDINNEFLLWSHLPEGTGVHLSVMCEDCLQPDLDEGGFYYTFYKINRYYEFLYKLKNSRRYKDK